MNPTNFTENPERDTADAAFAIQKTIARHANMMHYMPILIADLIAEVYEINPRSEVLLKWHLKLFDLTVSE